MMMWKIVFFFKGLTLGFKKKKKKKERKKDSCKKKKNFRIKEKRERLLIGFSHYLV